MKRVLFFSCWCRKRSSHVLPVEDDSGAFPLAIGSSFSPPSGFAGSLQSALRPQRQRHNPRMNTKTRKARPNPKDGPARGAESSRIPIRGGPETPRNTRLASSAPSHFSTPSPRTTQAALARMAKGGFKPRQTPARVMLNAAAASNTPKGPVESTSPPIARTGIMSGLSAERVRKERSESATPGSGSVLFDVEVNPGSSIDTVATGKRLKV